MLNGRIASRFAVLLSAVALIGGCAAQPNDVAWETGGALNGELPVTARIQYAQTSDDDDTDALYPDFDEDYDENDPLEIPNRFIFAFNQMLDVFVVKPAASTYRFLLPSAIRDSIRNFPRPQAELPGF